MEVRKYQILPSWGKLEHFTIFHPSNYLLKKSCWGVVSCMPRTISRQMVPHSSSSRGVGHTYSHNLSINPSKIFSHFTGDLRQISHCYWGKASMFPIPKRRWKLLMAQKSGDHLSSLNFTTTKKKGRNKSPISTGGW